MEHFDTMQGLPLAMAYVPWQSWQNVSDAARGLEQGTIFDELVFPFEYAGPGCRNTRQTSCPMPYQRSMQPKSDCMSPHQQPLSKYRQSPKCQTPMQKGAACRQRMQMTGYQPPRKEECSCQEMTTKNC